MFPPKYSRLKHVPGTNNLRDDIGEKKNLVKSNPEKTKELHDMLKAWRKDVKAPVPTEPNPKFDAEAEARARAGKAQVRKRKRAKKPGPATDPGFKSQR